MALEQENLRAIPKIAQLREKAGLTQLELSRRIGVTETTIQNWEKGRAGMEQIERVIKLCKALDCELEDLIEYAQTPATEVGETTPKGRLKRIRKRLHTDKVSHTHTTSDQMILKRR